MGKILIIEPYYGGSHKEMLKIITAGLQPDEYHMITMKPTKWHWRARCSSLFIWQQIPDLDIYTHLFCSSILNLTELIGLCPKVQSLKKIVYFHENQLVYPVRQVKDRDFQYGYNQILTCLSADYILFNSIFNKNSFLENIKKFMKTMPDYRPNNLTALILPKCEVFYYPIDFSLIDEIKAKNEEIVDKDDQVMHIVWPHRWEFDKNPELFFKVLFDLQDENVPFKVSVLGESYCEIPKIFSEAKARLGNRIINYGYVESKEEFYKILCSADIVVSTADHEFFGVSIAEAVRANCMPLLPNKLVYPELYPDECLYKDEGDLKNKLKTCCKQPNIFKSYKIKMEIDTEMFNADKIIGKFLDMLKY